MLYFYRNSRHKAEKNIPLAAQDPFDQIVSVVKTQLFVFGMLLVILFSIHKGSVVSRTVLGISFITCIILDGILHLLYGRHLREMLLKHPVIRKLLLVSCLSDISVAIHHLEKSDRSLSVCAVLPVDQTVWQQNEINGIPVIPLNGGCLPDLSQREIREAFLYFPDAKVCPSEIINMLESQNITIHHAIMLDGMAAGERLIGKLGCYQTVTEKDMHQRCDILGVHFVPANISGAVFYVRKHIHDLQGRYICFCNVHTTVESYRDPQYCAIQNGAALTLADGAPIMKQEQKRGFADAERVAGPDFMTSHVCSNHGWKSVSLFLRIKGRNITETGELTS
jgi:N-acetylglucosaminyldiphosphoundecaprenol N-acetyl-beta-D-mannosaminyltransferase